jgi:exosortase/archaeosortase family protein
VLILYFLLALVPLDIDDYWRQCCCFWLLLIAPLRFSSGHRVTVLAMIPLFVFCIFLPRHSEIMLAISHPFRIIATGISGTFLRLFGFNVSSTLTVLRLDNVDLAVTDACSGIQQFEALLLGYILAKRQQKRLTWRIIHYVFCIPAVIFANAIRLVLVVMLYHWPVGDAVLYSGWHEGLGYFQVLVAVLIMWVVGRLLDYGSAPLRGE